MTEPKFCKDCKHFQERGGIYLGACLTWPDSCTQPPDCEPIRGNKIGADPIRMRSEEGACKPEAMLWEKRPAPALKPKPEPELLVNRCDSHLDACAKSLQAMWDHDSRRWWEFWK